MERQPVLKDLNRAVETRKRFRGETLEALEKYAWPGNVRELKNAVQRAYILADEKITRECLPAEITGEESARGPSLHVRVGSSIADVERRLVLSTLDQLGGDKNEPPPLLGVSLKTLYNRLNSYGDEDRPS